MRVLILDDDPKRHEEFRRLYSGHCITHVFTANDAIDTLLREEAFDVVQLDHDLGGKVYVASDAESGFVVARAIAEMAGAKRHGQVIIHSWNPTGAKNMVGVLIDKMIPVSYRPASV